MQREMSKIVFIFLTILFFSLLVSCSGENGNRAGETPKAPVKVTYRLKWLLNASAAGDIWAQNAGFFKREGIEASIKEGGAEQDAITDILMGRATFGTASADQVFRAVSKGADIVVAAQIFQANPLQWIYFSQGRNIDSPESLRGLTIGITYGGNDETIFTALMKKYSLTEKDLRLYAVHYDYAPFWKHEVALWPVYRNTEGIILQEKMAAQGHKADFFDPARFGIDFVANSLVTSRHTWETRPELVRKFARALSAAWNDALDAKNIKAAAMAVHKYDSDTPVETIIKQLESTRHFVIPDGAVPGEIDIKAWQQTADIMFDEGLIDRKIDIISLLIPEMILPTR